jgi:2-methylisocitrate lyase-like PEP mutase family enzyme
VFDDAPLIIPSVWDAASARAAVSAGAGALFLSGSALAASLGYPDIGLVSLDDLTRATARIAGATSLPLIVDAECGFGGLAELAHGARSLQAAGARGILIEDQDFTGQSVSRSNPKLSDPAVMVARIRVAKEATNGALGVLARTDLAGAEWRFEDTLERLERYREAKADWLTAVFLRSQTELASAVGISDGRFVAIAVPGVTRYVPEPSDAFEAGCVGVIVTGFLHALFPQLRELYGAVLRGDTRELRARRLSSVEFSHAMAFERFAQRDDVPR